MISGWVITRDPFNEASDFNIPSRVGWGQVNDADVIVDAETLFPRTITVATELDSNNIVNPVRFRLIDEDGELHYEGVISREWLDGEEIFAFAPLHFATNDSGATFMEYETRDGRWEQL